MNSNRNRENASAATGPIRPSDSSRPDDAVDHLGENASLIDPELRQQVGSSLSWGLLGQGLRRGANVITTWVFARWFLEQEDFGVFTIAFTVATFLMAFTDVGVSYGLVRFQGKVEDLAATGASIAISFSIFICGMTMLAAPGIARLLTAAEDDVHPDAVALIRVLALTAILDGFSKVPAAGLTRELRERERTTAELIGFFCSVVLSLSLAATGAGAWALVWGQLVAVAITALIIIIRSPLRWVPGWDTGHARYLLGFGLPLAGAGILNQLILNSDYPVVSRYLGGTLAGVYFIAFAVSNWPVSLISFAMRRTAVAGFSKIQDDREQLQNGFVSAMQALWTITIPMALLIGFLASEILQFYKPDGDYLSGTVALQYLAAISLVRLTYQLCTDLLAAMGRSTAVFTIQIAWIAAVIPSMIYGAKNHGLAGVGAAQLIASFVVATPLLVWRLRSEGLRLRPVFTAMRRGAVGGVVLVAVILLMRELIADPAVRLPISALLAGLAYLAVVMPGTTVADQLRDRVTGSVS